MKNNFKESHLVVSIDTLSNDVNSKVSFRNLSNVFLFDIASGNKMAQLTAIKVNAK